MSIKIYIEYKNFVFRKIDLAKERLLKIKMSSSNQFNPNVPGARYMEQPPVVAQPAGSSDTERIQVKKSFVFSFVGVLRLVLIVSEDTHYIQ